MPAGVSRGEQEEVERLVVDDHRVAAMRPVRMADAVRHHAGRVHEHAPRAAAGAGAPRERRVLVREAGVDAERILDLRMDELAALVERAEFLAEAVDRLARLRARTPRSTVRRARTRPNAGSRVQPRKCSSVIDVQHRRALPQQAEAQRRRRRARASRRRWRTSTCRGAWLRRRARARAADDEAVVGPRVGTEAQAERAARRSAVTSRMSPVDVANDAPDAGRAEAALRSRGAGRRWDRAARDGASRRTAARAGRARRRASRRCRPTAAGARARAASRCCARGRHVQRLQVGAAERAHRRAHRRAPRYSASVVARAARAARPCRRGRTRVQ